MVKIYQYISIVSIDILIYKSTVSFILMILSLIILD